MSALVGSRGELVEAESSFTVKVIQENASLGKLVVLLDSGELQNFFRSDLTSINVLKECGEGNIVTRMRIIYSRREDTGEIWEG